MRKILPILGFLLFSFPAHATTRYVAQTAGVVSDTHECNGQTAITPATFNAITLAPDDVTWLCGTITGTANTNIIVVSANGTSGHPITFKWETGAILQEPFCPPSGNGGCFQVLGHSFITLDGNVNGIIQNTANGSALANQQNSTAIENDGGTNFIVKNLSIVNIYVHSLASDSITGNSNTNCIYGNGVVTNWQILNNTMHDMSWCINIQFNTSSNLTITGNTIYNVDHAIATGGPSDNQNLDAVVIAHNNIHDYANWDTTLNTYHHDGFHLFGHSDNGTDLITHVSIFDNVFGGCMGNNSTAQIFIEANAGGSNGALIYNNTIQNTCTSTSPGNGLITTGIDSGHKIYNNTLIGASTDTCVDTSSSPGIVYINNVASTCATLMSITTAGGFAASSLANNIYANCGGGNCFSYHGTSTGSFATWQSNTGQDASPSAKVSSAGLNSAGAPQAGSAVIGQGQNLTSLGISTLNSDINGVPRPTGATAWDVGAFVFQSGGATTYYIAPASLGGSDSNNGLTPLTPWLSPNHAVNCGDILLALASTAYDATNFQSGKWGTVTCAANNNVTWVKCITFDACKITVSSGNDAMRVSASYWGVQGWEATATTGFASCFTALPPVNNGSNIHHIIFANDIANGCFANGLNSYSNGTAGVDYIVIIGSIAYNAAQGSAFCYQGFSIAAPTQTDSLPGTHILIAGNFAWNNFDPNPCNGGAPTDGEGGIFDSWNANAYTAQGVMENNIFLSNGGRGLEILHSNSGAVHATIYTNHDTLWNNSRDNNQNVGDCGEHYIAFSTHVESSWELAVTNQATGCNGHNLYAYVIDGGDATDHVYQSLGYSAAGNNTLVGSSGSFAYGPSMTFANPNLSNPSTPSAPSCSGFADVPHCMTTVIANFTPTTPAAKSFGYQIPGTANVFDPLYPQWLCTVTNLPPGLVTPGCLPVAGAIGPGATFNPGLTLH